MAFVPSTSFIPKCAGSHATCPVRTRGPMMVESKDVRRSAEIERLTKQLAELRAKREKMATPSVADPSSEPKESTEISNDIAPPSADPVPASSVPEPSDLKFGKHSAGSRFLSISNLQSDEYFPRVLTVAGTIPELKVKDYFDSPSVLQNKSPEAGNSFLTVLPPGYEGQIIALPGAEIISKCKDPVVVLAPPSSISAVSLPAADDDLIALVVDRNVDNTEFDKLSFYVWAVGDDVHVGWLNYDPPPHHARRIGNVILGIIDIRPDLRRSKSCWEEENEVYSD